METAARPHIRFSRRVHRRIQARQRLVLSAGLGLLVALAIPGPLPPTMRAAINTVILALSINLMAGLL